MPYLLYSSLVSIYGRSLFIKIIRVSKIKLLFMFDESMGYILILYMEQKTCTAKPQCKTNDLKGDSEHVDASVLCFQCLVRKKLSIPDYQRPYTWSMRHIRAMLEDFKEHCTNKKDTLLPYYMGSIILHKKDDEYFIVDGQQRITTLLILRYTLDQNGIWKDYEYSNEESKRQIKNNYDLIRTQELDTERLHQIFDALRFTTITTTSQDNAFTFFDAQNNRGVKPSVTVLHKAYNLRCIDSAKEETQKACAKWWEDIDNKRSGSLNLTEELEQLEWIIKIFLWRARNWRGDMAPSTGSYENFRDAFTKQLRDKSEDSIYRDYFDNYATGYAVRQPIYRGLRFFRFVRHYNQQLEEIMLAEITDGKTFRDLYNVHKTGSKYMASFFVMVSMVYYDRFGSYKLARFVEELSHSMANIRMDKASICQPTMEKRFIRCEEGRKYARQNILDFISSAFDAQEILDWWQKSNKELTEALRYNNEVQGIRERFRRKYEEIYPHIFLASEGE